MTTMLPTVTFGGAAATVSAATPASVSCTAPAHTPGAVDIVVTDSLGASSTLVNGYTYIAPPVPLSVDPASGDDAGGTAVTITGAGFQDGASVTIGGASATSVVFMNSTTLTCTTPAGSDGAADVVVTNPDAQSGTLVDGFTYVSIGPIDTSLLPGTVLWSWTALSSMIGASVIPDEQAGSHNLFTSVPVFSLGTPWLGKDPIYAADHGGIGTPSSFQSWMLTHSWTLMFVAEADSRSDVTRTNVLILGALIDYLTIQMSTGNTIPAGSVSLDLYIWNGASYGQMRFIMTKPLATRGLFTIALTRGATSAVQAWCDNIPGTSVTTGGYQASPIANADNVGVGRADTMETGGGASIVTQFAQMVLTNTPVSQSDVDAQNAIVNG